MHQKTKRFRIEKQGFRFEIYKIISDGRIYVGFDKNENIISVCQDIILLIGAALETAETAPRLSKLLRGSKSEEERKSKKQSGND